MPVGGHPHDHVVHFYGDQQELVAGVLAHLLAPPAAPAVVIARPAVREAVARGMQEAGAHLPELLDARDTLGTFMVDGRPDGDRFLEVVGGVIARLATGPEPVRAFGEMVALLWDEGNVAGAIELEDLWNGLAASQAITLRCAYPMSSIAASDDLLGTRRVCEAHSDVVVPACGSIDPPGPVDPDQRARLFLPSPSSITGVRAFVAETFAGWGAAERTADALLVASELATNAIRHADSPVRVVLSRASGAITIAIADTSTHRPVPRTAGPYEEGGRGLRIVAALSADHGVELTTEGKTVWSKLALPA